MKGENRFYACETRGFNEAGNLEAIAVTGMPNRMQEVCSAVALDIAGYQKNPVVLYAHDWHGLPVGKVPKIWADREQLLFETEFAPHDQAQLVKQLYQQGFLNAFSIGFQIKATEWDGELDVNRITSAELLEISCVPVPADAGALATTSFYSYGGLVRAAADPQDSEDVEVYSAIPYKKTPLADEGEDWDAGAEVGSAEVDTLKIICTWYDAENPDVKSSYKLPHHKAAAPHSCVWRAVSAAGAALMGSRGGVNIPAGDEAAVKSHLAKHYREFDKQPPWEQSEAPQAEATGTVWQQSVRRMEHLIREIRNGRRDNRTDREALREITSIAASLISTSDQSGVYTEAIDALVRYLGEEDYQDVFVELDKLIGSRMPDRIPDHYMVRVREANTVLRQIHERGIKKL